MNPTTAFFVSRALRLARWAWLEIRRCDAARLAKGITLFMGQTEMCKQLRWAISLD